MKNKISVIGMVVLMFAVFSSAHSADPSRFIPVSASGEMYLNYAFNISGQEVDDETKYPNEFTVDRVYINFRSGMADKVAIRFTTDVDPGVVDNKGYGIRVKYAYADFTNYIPMTTVTLGLQENLWTGMADKAWGYRPVSKSLFDQYKGLASADIGLGAKVSIPEGYGELVLQALNGGGYKSLETNPGKALATRLLVTPVPKNDMLKGLGVAGFVYIDKDDDDKSKNRFGGMVQYKYNIVNLVGEFGMTKDDEVNGMGFAGSAEAKMPVTEGLLQNLAIIGRLDSWDKNTDKEKDEVMRIIAGVSYEMVKGVKAIVTFQNVNDKKADETTQSVVAQAHIKF